MGISVVIPVYNERESIRPLYDALIATLEECDEPFEILLIDDGSSDGSAAELERLADADERVRVIEFRRNCGQTAALHAGIHASTGEVIVTLDADLQNDPADIPAMIAKLNEGYDLVHGWRKDRKDALVSRRVPSRLANWLISRVTGFPVHDLGCGLKVLRLEVARELPLYGEMHRFIPVLAYQQGARCAEFVTRHHPRRFGESKYGLSRTLRVILDLITVQCLARYISNPMRLFGRLGCLCLAGGFAAAAALLGMKFLQGTEVIGNPLLLVAVLATFFGLQFFGMGLLGEMRVRFHHESQGDAPYVVRRSRNLDRMPAILPMTVEDRRAA